MVDMYARLDTAHGEDGSYLAKVNPPLHGLTLDEVTGITADVPPADESVSHTMAPDANAEEVVAGAMIEHPLTPGGVQSQTEGDTVPGDAEALEETQTDDGTVAADAPLSKTALRAMSKEDLVEYAENHGVDCTDATKEEIVAALYGE